VHQFYPPILTETYGNGFTNILINEQVIHKYRIFATYIVSQQSGDSTISSTRYQDIAIIQNILPLYSKIRHYKLGKESGMTLSPRVAKHFYSCETDAFIKRCWNYIEMLEVMES
jgi:hypothetical protein